MKRKALILTLALLLCLLLCACGAMTNDRDGARAPGTFEPERPAATARVTEAMPDAKDGYVDDGNAENGIVEESPSMPSPTVTHKP